MAGTGAVADRLLLASRRLVGNGENWVDYGQAAFRTKTKLQLLPDLVACAAERQQLKLGLRAQGATNF